MKKLLITTMAAASLAFCAKAADEGFISGINFESFADAAVLDPEAIENGEYRWSTDSEDGLFVVSNLNSFASTYPTSRPAHWADDASNEKALFIDSDKPLVRNVNAKNDQGDYPAYQLQNEGTDRNLFFDSVVQFTATDKAPTVDYDAGDKLIAWLYYSEYATTEKPGIFGETEPLKRLVITAGYYDTNGSRSTVNYLTSLEIEPDSWHRLTIKAINNIGNYVPGFEVYVDREKVGGVIDYSATDAAVITTFPSLVMKDGGGVNTVTGVAFDGKGAVDDLVFTTTDPFPQEATTYAITTEVANAVVGFYDVEFSNEYDASAIDVGVTSLIAYVTPKEGYEVTAAKLNGVDIEVPEYDAENEGYFITLTLNPVAGESYAFVLTTAESGSTEPETPTTYTAKATYDNTMVVVANLETAYEANASVSFTVTAVDGYEVTGVTMNGETLTGNNGTYSFAMPAANVEIVVTAQAKSYEITVVESANVTVSVDATTKKFGETVTVTISYDADAYALDTFTVVGVETSTSYSTTAASGANTFTMPAEDVKITATVKAAGGEDPEEEELPTIGDAKYDADSSDDFIAAAKSNTEIKVPAKWTLDGNTLKDADGNTYATFGEYYDVTLTDGTVTLTVNAKAAPSFGETESGKGDAITVTDTQFTVCINNAIEGFYYQLKAYSDAACTNVIGGYEGDEGDKATGTNLGVTMTKPEGYGAVFFKVFVDDKPFATTEAGTEE